MWIFLCYQTGLGPEPVYLRPINSVWVPDFVQETFHNMNSGDFESTYINAVDREQRKGLR